MQDKFWKYLFFIFIFILELVRKTNRSFYSAATSYRNVVILLGVFQEKKKSNEKFKWGKKEWTRGATCENEIRKRKNNKIPFGCSIIRASETGNVATFTVVGVCIKVEFIAVLLFNGNAINWPTSRVFLAHLMASIRQLLHHFLKSNPEIKEKRHQSGVPAASSSEQKENQLASRRNGKNVFPLFPSF